MPNICKGCNTSIENNSNFCPVCGTSSNPQNTPSLNSSSHVVVKTEKDVGMGYVLHILPPMVGCFGIHRLYFGHTASGIIMFMTFWVSLVLSLVLIGLAGLLFLALWWVIDLVTMQGLCDSANEKSKQEINVFLTNTK